MGGVEVEMMLCFRFLLSHTALLTLEYENMREVLYILSEQDNCNSISSSLRKIILENCRGDFDTVLEKCINSFPLLEALRYRNKHFFLRERETERLNVFMKLISGKIRFSSAL